MGKRAFIIPILWRATKAALRLADRLAGDQPLIDVEFHDMLRRHFSGDELIDLGMTLTFASGWQRFIEAFGIVPDRWRDGAPPPFRALVDTDSENHEHQSP